jgi:N-acetyl sugar amidotransferase
MNNIICTKCIYDEKILGISFDKDGICNYCLQIENLLKEYKTGLTAGENIFNSIVNEIKNNGKNKKYDCIIGVSGGTDSSYLLHLAKKVWGLKPLAVHYDNTWNSAIATININKMLKQLDIDLYTHVVDNKEVDDIFKSFFLAGVPELEASTDLGYAYLLRIVSKKFKIKYILEGHSFVTEGISPLGLNYFDGKYIKEIHKKFGKIKLKTYPLLTLAKFLKSIIFDRVKFIRPFWYINYSKESAQQFLKDKYHWRYYGGHHLENRMTAFYHQVYLPQKFNVDLRTLSLSALSRSGIMKRDDAINELKKKRNIDHGLIKLFKKRLNLTDSEYSNLMNSKPNYWQSYPTYKKFFEFFGPIFYLFAKLNLLTMSFYLKYCKKIISNDHNN